MGVASYPRDLRPNFASTVELDYHTHGWELCGEPTLGIDSIVFPSGYALDTQIEHPWSSPFSTSTAFTWNKVYFSIYVQPYACCKVKSQYKRHNTTSEVTLYVHVDLHMNPFRTSQGLPEVNLESKYAIRSVTKPSTDFQDTPTVTRTPNPRLLVVQTCCTTSLCNSHRGSLNQWYRSYKKKRCWVCQPLKVLSTLLPAPGSTS